MDWEEYEKWGKKGINWGSNYRKTIRNLPVRSKVKPGQVFNSIPNNPPEKPEPLDVIFDDFK